jgi:hypothetical protein
VWVGWDGCPPHLGDVGAVTVQGRQPQPHGERRGHRVLQGVDVEVHDLEDAADGDRDDDHDP